VSAVIELEGCAVSKITIPPSMTRFSVKNDIVTGHNLAATEKPGDCTLTLRSVVFTPSIRPGVAALNWSHVLTVGDSCLRVDHVVVCKREDFDAFCDLWGRTHAILQLPSTMEVVERLAKTSDNTWVVGGPDLTPNLRIGYSRLCIQRVCDHLGINSVFQFDDTVDLFSEYDLANRTLRRSEGGVAELQPCSFAVPMMMAERQLACDQAYVDKLTKWLQKTNEDPSMYADPGPPASQAGGSTTVQRFSGSADKYAVLGFARRSRFTATTNPFTNRHVYSAVLVNMKALPNLHHGQPVAFLPFPFREDITTQFRCDKEGLLVVKYNCFAYNKKFFQAVVHAEMQQAHTEVRIYSEHTVGVSGGTAGETQTPVCQYLASIWISPKLPRSTQKAEAEIVLKNNKEKICEAVNKADHGMQYVSTLSATALAEEIDGADAVVLQAMVRVLHEVTTIKAPGVSNPAEVSKDLLLYHKADYHSSGGAVCCLYYQPDEQVKHRLINVFETWSEPKGVWDLHYRPEKSDVILLLQRPATINDLWGWVKAHIERVERCDNIERVERCDNSTSRLHVYFQTSVQDNWRDNFKAMLDQVAAGYQWRLLSSRPDGCPQELLKLTVQGNAPRMGAASTRVALDAPSGSPLTAPHDARQGEKRQHGEPQQKSITVRVPRETIPGLSPPSDNHYAADLEPRGNTASHAGLGPPELPAEPGDNPPQLPATPQK